MKNKQTSFFKNTLIILTSGFLIKALGLLNKIFITRLLKTEGMNLYMLSFPTILLFISFSSLSLNVCLSKLISESLATKKYSPKILLKSSINLSLIASFFTIILFLLFLKPITSIFLKNEDLKLPLLSCLFLIPLTGISDSLKGYFNGLKQMRLSSSSSLIEQIARIISSFFLIKLTLNLGIKIATFFCLLSLSLGEIASIIFSLVKIKPYIINYENTKGEKKAILEMAIPSTFSKACGNITYFLEPIFYIFVLSIFSYPQTQIETTYTIFSAYTFSLITLGSFISMALATTIIPEITTSFYQRKMNLVNYFIKKTLLFALIPGVIISTILFFYSEEIMMLVYKTTKGAIYVKHFVFLFLPFYIQAPLSAIYQALGKVKDLFLQGTIFNLLRLLLIFILAFFPSIRFNSLIFACFITLDLHCLILFLKIKKITSLKVNFKNSFNLFLIFIFIFILNYLFVKLNLHFIISICLLGIIYFILCLSFKLIDIKSTKRMT